MNDLGVSEYLVAFVFDGGRSYGALVGVGSRIKKIGLKSLLSMRNLTVANKSNNKKSLNRSSLICALKLCMMKRVRGTQPRHARTKTKNREQVHYLATN